MADLLTMPYLEQTERWPTSGRHILAHFDDSTIVVYQAYRPSIARYALEHGRFGGPEFSFTRMSWVKPNFLWMMYRSSWATSEGQESVLGIRIRREFFDELLGRAVASSYDPQAYATRAEWQLAVQSSEVRLQWDPDHDPCGGKLERRAVQLGLRGGALRSFATEQVLEIIDMGQIIEAGRKNVTRGRWQGLYTPVESVYRPLRSEAASAVGLDDFDIW